MFGLLWRWIHRSQSTLDISRIRSLLYYHAHDSLDNFSIQRLLDISAASLRHLQIRHQPKILTTHPLDLRTLLQLHTISREIWLDTITPQNALSLLSLLSLDEVIFPLQQQALQFHVTIYAKDVREEVVPLLVAADRPLAAIACVQTMTVIMLARPEDEQYVSHGCYCGEAAHLVEQRSAGPQII
ncbi:hypothetical protein C8R45DRAFT_992764 [Mycena sanguinolenta]|nr:hypothetical protein C8R45DRAFT_992764 [Mycena sanguinolenta]